MSRGFGLYIHVPFCGSICSYCHFARTARHSPEDRARYVDAVLEEFALRSRACGVLAAGRRFLRTAYIGGGTPSCLETPLMERLLAGTVGQLTAVDDLELTAEANPESLDPAKARAWAAAGVNRLSLGMQSLQPAVLQSLGRRCDPATALAALELAGRIFARVSADWIIGPGLTLAGLTEELDRALDLGVTHFSLYILEVAPGNRAGTAGGRGRRQAAPRCPHRGPLSGRGRASGRPGSGPVRGGQLRSARPREPPQPGLLAGRALAGSGPLGPRLLGPAPPRQPAGNGGMGRRGAGRAAARGLGGHSGPGSPAPGTGHPGPAHGGGGCPWNCCPPEPWTCRGGWPRGCGTWRAAGWY